MRSMKLPALAAPGTRCPLNGYVAVLATSVIDHISVPAYLRTAVGPLGSRYTYIHSMEKESATQVDIELVDGSHYRCGPGMTVFVPEAEAARLGITPPAGSP